MAPSVYNDLARISQLARSGHHRDIVGGLWEEIGALQLELLLQKGLNPKNSLLDVGCGSLRAGRHLVRYLDAGNYFGIEQNATLVEAGIEKELFRETNDDLEKISLIKDNIYVNSDFSISKKGYKFDFILAFSLFTHLEYKEIVNCLLKLRDYCNETSVLLATFFIREEELPPATPLLQPPGEITTYSDRDPYDYKVSTINSMVSESGWQMEGIREFGHPRGQRLAELVPAGQQAK